MARRHSRKTWAWPTGLLLVAALGLSSWLSCSSSAPRDINFGTDAGAGFEIPQRETGTDTTDSGGAGAGGVGGQAGAGGAAGAGGESGAGGGADASTDA